VVAVPSYISSNARQGIKLLEYAGDGLKAQTISEARDLASGSATPNKVMRMAAWLARHESDLKSPDARAYLNGASDKPTAGQVAWLLWGGDISNVNQDRAKAWAEKERDRLIEAGKLSKAETVYDYVSANRTGATSDTVTVMYPMMTPPANEPQPVDLVTAMQDMLANVFVFYASAHRAHWNVTGQDFLQYHSLFADIYDDVYGSVDPFAENIRKIKGRPLNLTEMVNTAMFADDSQTSDAYELAADLFAKNAKVVSMLKMLFEVAEENEEEGIANFVAERIDAHMKWDWQLSASLAS
jgi:starvation-inducible DNA-binding protein